MTLETSPVPIIAPAPYRRATAVRHRRNVTVWSLDRRIRYVRAYLRQRSRRTRGDMVLFGVACAASTVVADLILLAGTR